MIGCKGHGSSSSASIPQSDTNWAWQAGANSANSIGFYPTPMGTATATGAPSGRATPMTWLDSTGQFWVFSGTAGYSDMWKFNTATLQWAWMAGNSNTSSINAGIYPAAPGPTSGALTNLPGQRFGGATWVDVAGNFWMFGGNGTDANGSTGLLSDLWSYSPSSNWWTWQGGASHAGVPASPPTNYPSARYNAAHWTSASGIFYLFGGQGIVNSGTPAAPTVGALNDLWQFNPTTSTWTLINGIPGSLNISGVYGATTGTASASNQPGGRHSATTWTDSSGNFWLFGGAGIDAAGKSGQLNDLWKFSTTSNQWTWVNGANSVNTIGNYGTNAVAAATNQPGARFGGVGWIDRSGNLWMAGGYGLNYQGTLVYLNDLWEYRTTSNQWVWVNGSYVGNAAGVYGTLGVLTSYNTPGSRYGSSGWRDSAGNFWMYGGTGYDAAGTNGNLGDIWKFAAPN